MTVAGGKDERYLIVRGESTALRLALPPLGSISIGEALKNDVRIHEPGVAAEHAVLYLDHGIGLKAVDGDATLLARDLKGRPKREQVLDSGQTVELELGDRVRLGPVELSFAAGNPAVAGRRVLSRAYLERRLKDLLGPHGHPALAVARLQLRGGPGAETIEQAIGEPLRPTDLVADLGSGEYAILMLEVTESHARRLVAAVASHLAGMGVEVLAGVAGGAEAKPNELLELARQRLARPAAGSGARRASLVSVDPEMQKVVKIVERVAKSGAHVLILGETGTGKDLIAQMLHDLSERSTGPFVRVSSVDLPDTLWEGPAAAFLDRARGGTVYFDEVGSFSPRAQLGLGYLWEESRGGHDVRFIASTNQDLGAKVSGGTFRKDLFFRLNKLTIVVPPLRERSGDIVPLAELFSAEAVAAAGRDEAPGLSETAKDSLSAHAWPGNVRELKNVIERAVLLCTGRTLGLEHLPEEMLEGSGAEAPGTEGAAGDAPKPANLRDEIAALEKRRILEALRKYPTQREAALSLNMPMRTFLNRLDALGITRARGGGGQKEG